jgi:hypothetical protein
MGRFYTEVDLPRIPDELLNLKASDVFTQVDSGYGHQFYKNGRKLISCVYTRGRLDNEPLRKWIYSNIKTVPVNRITVRTLQGNNNDSTLMVHSDYTIAAALVYYTQLGGDNVTTTYYQERGHNLHRSKKISGGGQSDTGIVEYDNLIELETAQFKPYTWYLMCASVLHDADHVNGTREFLSIGITNPEDLAKSGFPNILG